MDISSAGRYCVGFKTQLTGGHDKQYVTADVSAEPEIDLFNRTTESETDFQIIDESHAKRQKSLNLFFIGSIYRFVIVAVLSRLYQAQIKGLLPRIDYNESVVPNSLYQ